MIAFRDTRDIFGANELYEAGRLGYYTNARNFVVGKIYVDNDNLIAYFEDKPFKALLFTADGLKEFTTTKDKAYADAATYGQTGDSTVNLSLFNNIYANGRKILSIWSNGRKLYQANRHHIAKIAATIWGKPQVTSDRIYFYLREQDTPKNLIKSIDYVTDILLGDTSIGSNVSVQATDGFYLFAVKGTISDIVLRDYMQVTFLF
ncbi:MAG: hypothetical protein DI617_03750 [Streptococcus pyogenes]|nr:MAG: hypothetical protein DI617_03750 [Streptococcus pyogenes]